MTAGKFSAIVRRVSGHVRLNGGAITAIIAITLGITLARSAATPVIAMTTAMTKLAAGDLNVTVPVAGRTDEIGEMAAAVAVFQTNALENRRLEQEAATQRSQSEEQRRLTAEQDRIRAEAMAQAVDQLRVTLASVTEATGSIDSGSREVS